MARSPRRIAASALPAAAAEPAPAPPPRCFYSTALDGDLAQLLGAPHYSYRFAEAKFRAAFAAAGLALTLLPAPEACATARALPGNPASDMAGGLVHLIFRSTEHIRLLKPARNIACFAWEFEVLRDWTGPNEHPFRNQVRMLSLCDEVWVPCTFTRDVLRRHGIGPVHVIPAPVVTPDRPRRSRLQALAAIGQVGVMPLVAHFLRPAAENARIAAHGAVSLLDVLAPPPGGTPPLVYLAVLNPEDFRKNLDAMLRGFDHFQQAFGPAVLIVKLLTAASRFPLDRAIAEILPNKLASGTVFANDRIVFFNRFLSDDDMGALFDLADFYLCTSLAEGQNLPLLEAMAHGVVPVSTAVTAMADYIDPDNSFVIETTRLAAPSEHLAGATAGRPYQVDRCDSRQVYDALMRSAHAHLSGRQRRAEAARRTVRARYAPQAVWSLIAARLTAADAPRVLAA